MTLRCPESFGRSSRAWGLPWSVAPPSRWMTSTTIPMAAATRRLAVVEALPRACPQPEARRAPRAASLRRPAARRAPAASLPELQALQAPPVPRGPLLKGAAEAREAPAAAVLPRVRRAQTRVGSQSRWAGVTQMAVSPHRGLRSRWARRPSVVYGPPGAGCLPVGYVQLCRSQQKVTG